MPEMPQINYELAGYKSFRALYKEGEVIEKFLPAPATLYPTPFPRALFDTAYALAPLFNDLCNSMVVNVDWLLESYQHIQLVDDFVKHFVDITRKVYVDGNKDIKKSLKAYVVRSDYLPYRDGDQLRLGQVEINLSSVVGPDVVQDLYEYHRDMIDHYSTGSLYEDPHRVPESRARTYFGEFMSLIPQVYNRRFGVIGDKQIILFVTGNVESNLTEIYSEIRELRKHRIPTYCVTFDRLVLLFDEKKAEVTRGADNVPRIFIQSSALRPNDKTPVKFEVSCVYWRTAYRPEHYPTPLHWNVREILESSEAVVIPSAISQLAGLKKVQQLWCLEHHLKKLVPSDLARSMLQACFVDQVDPSAYNRDPKTKSLVDEAMEHPERFVLKPQREGGANNYYKLDIPPLLEKERALDISSYILMRRIPALTNAADYIRDECAHHVENCISELGVYGAALWNGEMCEHNAHMGHLLRTKPEAVDEGGVSINAAVFDSPYLID